MRFSNLRVLTEVSLLNLVKIYTVITYVLTDILLCVEVREIEGKNVESIFVLFPLFESFASVDTDGVVFCSPLVSPCQKRCHPWRGEFSSQCFL